MFFAVQIRHGHARSVRTSSKAVAVMFEKELDKLQREIGELKHDLMGNGGAQRPGDEEGYQLATKIDLTVSRVLRIIDYDYDYKCESAP